MKSDAKYDYNRFGSKGKRVGQAVVDILSKDHNSIITTGEINEDRADEYRQELEKAIEKGSELYENPFYVLVLTHKEFWATNVVRNWFIPRQTAPFGRHVFEQYSHHMKTLYLVDTQKGNIKICWSIPGVAEMISIGKSPQTFDKQLIAWINALARGDLDKEKWDFDDDWRDRL